MSTATLAYDDLRPRADRRLGLGAVLALLAHGGLIVALALGLNWRLPIPPAVMSAELWSAVPQAAAPAAVAPPPPPVAVAAPVPEPTLKPAPPPEPVRPTAAERDAEIAIEKAAQRKKEQQAQEATAERERALKEQEAARLNKQKLEDKRLADEKAAQRKKEQQARDEKLREDKRQKELAEQRQRQQREAEAKTQDAAVAKQREENLKRMLGQAGVAGATGAANATGKSARDYAPSASYAGKIRKEVQANIFQTTEIVGTPTTEVLVLCAPDGSITGRKITKPSGNPAWDETVLRAIDRTARLSRDVDGQIPTSFLLVMSPS